MSTTKRVNREGSWDEAILDAERKLAKTRLAVVEIEKTIENLKRYKGLGHPFPGENAGANGKAAPA